MLEAIADALDRPKPFHFGNGSFQDHVEQLKGTVLTPIEESKLFDTFQWHERLIEEELPISNFVSYLKTLSNHITMQEFEATLFFVTVERTL